MKQITPEIKQRIFALYWGCLIDTSLRGTPISSMWMDKLENNELDACILVKPLSSISDEDKLELSKVYGSYPYSDNNDRIETVDEMIEAWEYKTSGRMFEMFQMAFIVDLLRSKGYALPACGFTIEQLIEAGVFKITES